MVNPVVPALIGLGGGVAIGYIIRSTMGAGLGLPLIKAFPSTVPTGAKYTLYFEKFPPNTQLVSPRNASIPGGDLVNLGITGADGVLTISNITAVGAGNYYIVAFDAPTGKYCAVYTLIVT